MAPVYRDFPGSRYNLDTYWGRVRNVLEIIDPRTLWVTEAEVAQAKVLKNQYGRHQIPEMTEELWQAKKILDSTVHPDTGKIIYPPWRMSCFVFTNLVVTAGMLSPNNGQVMTAFWQIANQYVNVKINSNNANKSTPETETQARSSYLMAISVSCGMAWGLNSLIPRLRGLPPTTRLVFSRLVPFAAVVSAGLANIAVMRAEEVLNGVQVYDDEGTIVGKSKKAGFLAVSETAASRILNAAPVMAIPPLILIKLQRQQWLANRPKLTLPVNLALIFGVSVVALPLAIGIFPRRQRIAVEKLEPEFHHHQYRDGQQVQYVWFNRGI